MNQVVYELALIYVEQHRYHEPEELAKEYLYAYHEIEKALGIVPQKEKHEH